MKMNFCKSVEKLTYKDQIKNSAQKILSALDNPSSEISIDAELLEIFNILGKIGTISGTSEKISGYTNALVNAFTTLRNPMAERIPIKSFYQEYLNQLCSVSFDVKQKGKKYEITIPVKFESIFKFGV